MARILRENGLSIVFFGLFATFLIGQTVAGHAAYDQQRKNHGSRPVSYWAYLASGHNIEAIAENWESEFLQMGSNVLLTVFLVQKGSAASKKLGRSAGGNLRDGQPGPDAPWPARQGGWVRGVYAYSLSWIFFLLFAFSFYLHALGGRIAYNAERAWHGHPPVSLIGFLSTSDFWFQSLQNYQSEFLALGSLVVLSIYLRQKGSPQSKLVDAPVAATGH